MAISEPNTDLLIKGLFYIYIPIDTITKWHSALLNIEQYNL